MWSRNTVALHHAENPEFETPAMDLSILGLWQDPLVINERYIGISPKHPEVSELTVLDFASNS